MAKIGKYMTPKEKADDLCAKFLFVADLDSKVQAKTCAEILVDEILNNMMLYEEHFDIGLKIHHRWYWEEVNLEIGYLNKPTVKK